MFGQEEDKYLTYYQQECMVKVGQTLQLEQQAYMEAHPEVKAMLALMISKAIRENHRKTDIGTSLKFLVQPTEVIDKEIRKFLGIHAGCYSQNVNMEAIEHKLKKVYPEGLELDLLNVKMKEYPPKPMSVSSSSRSSSTTLSSSFLTLLSSDTTLPTPEPIPTPEPTMYDYLFAMATNAVDKACFLHVTEEMLIYDTAYVEVRKMIEAAMEVPIVEIRMDIASTFEKIYNAFEDDIIVKEKIAAERAWEKRMRKKMKKTLRRLHNFKGYESPPKSVSGSSDDEEDDDDNESSIVEKLPPDPPCVCHPQSRYNRYAKDRFGIYLPQENNYCDVNVTVTPTFSEVHLS